MSTVRSVVFPALRLVVWAVIAVALVVLAFRGGTGSGPDPAGAGGPAFVDVEAPPIPVSTGTVSNTVTVTGTVVADPSVTVKATAAGTVRRLLASPGPVTAGQALLEIRWEEEREPVTGTDADGNPTVTQPAPRVRTATVAAPTAGTLTSLDVLVDQIVAVGDRVGTISPGTLSVTATLSQAEQFRLLSPPSAAEVEVQGGPAPFTCGSLVLGPAASAPADEPDPGMPAGPAAPASGGTTARCAVPAGTAVFAGMGATMTIQAGLAENVLVVPITAVQGSVQTGNVWVVGGDGEPAERAVTLGLTDGDMVEIREGLTEGEQILQFVPVPDDTPIDPFTGEPMMGGPYG
jgi:multidrug efflux pump subunit AcrA (membrane-fusion protein)